MARVLYDGWDLVYRPNSPAALHLLTLLEASPAGVQALAALPGEAHHPLPPNCIAAQDAVPDTPRSRLGWEQRRLPRLAKRLDADLVHSFSGAALFSGLRQVYSPADLALSDRLAGQEHGWRGFAERLREALGEGGLRHGSALFWPQDLQRVSPERRGALPLVSLPAAVHPEFLSAAPPPNGRALATLDLPETFVLYQGSEREASLKRLLGAWTWAAGPIGEYYPLLAVGLSAAGCERFAALAAELGLEGRARCLPALSLQALAAVYRASSAIFHPEASPAWGSPLRRALACGKPLVGLDEPLSDAILGEAAYLVKPGGTETERCRALGAALITVIVEESVAQSLSTAARRRAEQYNPERFSAALGMAYQNLAS